MELFVRLRIQCLLADYTLALGLNFDNQTQLQCFRSQLV